MVLPVLLAMPVPLSAETLLCALEPDCADESCAGGAVDVSFAIDRTQFSPALDASDPPRRQVTDVRMGEVSFQAEPVLLADGTVRGFWGEDIDGADILMIVHADNSAVLTDTRSETRLTGGCVVS